MKLLRIKLMNEEDPVQVFVVAGKGQTTSSISGSLEAAGFSVRIFHAGTAVLQAARDQMPTLIIFDVPPLNVDDDDLFRSLSAHEILESTRTIVLSDRDAEEDKVGALEAGADDYITKPFSERELVARVRAVLRSGRNLHQNHVLHIGTISADLDARRVWTEGQEQHLTATEFNLLVHFMHNPGRTFGRRELLSSVWPKENNNRRVVSVYIYLLRKKIEADSSKPVRLITCGKDGYMLVGSNGPPNHAAD
jgi:DNA-binding response OmpR family regulator